MEELAPDKKNGLTPFERSIYETIKEEVELHEGRSVDPTRSRFLLYNPPKFIRLGTGETVVCEIRRTHASLLDLDFVFTELGPRIDAGPPPAVIPERWKLEYRIWEIPSPWPAEPEEVQDQVNEWIRDFLRDWLEGHLTFITTYAGSKAFHWILKRGEVILGQKRRRLFFSYFAERRTVSQHT